MEKLKPGHWERLCEEPTQPLAGGLSGGMRWMSDENGTEYSLWFRCSGSAQKWIHSVLYDLRKRIRSLKYSIFGD